MKKIFAFFAAALMTASLSAATIYCKMTQSWWTVDGAAVAVHYWGGTSAGTTWPGVRMTAVSGETGMWSYDVPADVTGLMFVRVNGSGTIADWGAKTSDLTMPTDGKNLYTITSTSAVWGDPGCDGEWSVYDGSGTTPGGDDPGTGGDDPGTGGDCEEYGLMIDGVYHAGEKNPNPLDPEFNEYMILGVELTAGQYVQLYNNCAHEAWIITKYSDTSYEFEVEDGKYKVTETGTYDFYPKFKYQADELYVSCSGCTQTPGGGGDDPGTGGDCEEYGLLIDDVYHAGQKNPDPLDPEFNEYMILGVELTAGQYVQLYNNCAHEAWIITKYSDTSYEFFVENGKYKVTETGTYDFYPKFKYGADELYVSCAACTETPPSNSSVPRQCEDVMIQAFYNESYQPNSSVYGTDLYGDTKWATLLPQAEEIANSFDLIWLPPSAYGSGMGYHPKQYSNQNSNWGTREELDALIEAFHNAGSKVVADIVINHCEGWSSWCDFPEMDFGEYGKFQPDASYICKNDEVNWDENKPTATSEGSGACWGTATGNNDDGDNWSGARDWAHDNVYVQEMFIAYLQWMRNVMKYDGFRYDKGDGFNNWHHYNYNQHAHPYIAFMESYNGTDEIQREINQANGDLMGLDFDLKWHVFNSIAGWDYSKYRGDCIMSRGDGRHAVTFMESHDWFLRPDNDNEFCGRGNSMKPEIKARLLQCNAMLLSMPGVPCIFYPHWAKYKDNLKQMILARKWAGVHSESEVKDEYATGTGYQATIVGKNGWLILCLGDRANKQGFEGFTLATSNYSTMDGHNESFEIWVLSDKPKPEGLDGGGQGGGGDEGQCQDGPYGLKINGTKVVDAPLYGEPDLQGRIQYMASCVDLKAGDVIQLVNKSCDATWMVDLDQYGHYENFSGGKDANQLTCLVAGKYDFYIKLSIEFGDLVYVETSQTCSGGGDQPTPDPGYTTSAPAQCPDVMLQAFYWDSYQTVKTGSTTEVYGRTKWVDHMRGVNGSSAEEIGQWFDLVWLPPMSRSTGGTGYLPTNYSDLNGDWGTKKKLQELIDTLHINGARVVADIVINHGNTLTNNPCQFAQLNFGEYGTFNPDPSWICKTDEMNWESERSRQGACYNQATGGNDDGYYEANYDSGRDWDHTQARVRDMFKAYLKWLRNDIKIDGFRYDYCTGFHNSHIDDYNKAAQAYFSVMEYWDGNTNNLQSHLNDAAWNTLTFDFATKFSAFNGGVAGGDYTKLKGAGLLGAGKARYAVTFLDSHDTFLRKDDNDWSNEFIGYEQSMATDANKAKVLQCNAYMLSMPGIPCVFWPHWVTFKDQIKAMINARYKAGVNSESSVSDEAGSGFYKATITGTNGQIRLLLGPNSGYNSTPAGFTLAVKGTNFGVYYKMNNPRGDKDTERQPITEAIEVVNADGEHVEAIGQKFIKDGNLFIRCGEYIFNVMGGRVK